jgi:phosphogluconate dehydratase
MGLHPRIAEVTERIQARSRIGRAHYRDRISRARDARPRRGGLACGNLAHGFAACASGDKAKLATDVVPNLAIMGRELFGAFRAFPGPAETGAGVIGMRV